MKFVQFLNALVAPSVNDELAKLDAHLLADIGYNTANARTDTIRVPVEAGVRLA